MDLNAIQTRLVEVLRLITGLPSGKVYLANQRGPKSDPPALIFWIESINAEGMDDVHISEPLNPEAGSELVFTYQGHRKLRVILEAYTAETTGGAQALRLVSKVQTGMRRHDVRAKLKLAGLAFTGTGDARIISTVLDDDQEGRASVELTFYAVDSQAVGETYIETVKVAGLQPHIPDHVDTFQVVEES